MIVATVMILLGTLTMMGVLGLAVMLAGVRSSGAQREAARALYCAEAGLAAGQTLLSTNVGSWNSYLACGGGGACPSGYPFTGAAAADGSSSYQITIEDNLDELPPLTNNPLADTDMTLVMVSRCTDPALPQRIMRQYVVYDYRELPDYRAQSGQGRTGSGNQN